MSGLHKSSWAVCLLMVLISVMVIVPGRIDEWYWSPDVPYSHGWPAEFMRRHVDATGIEWQDDEIIPAVNWAIVLPPDEPPWAAWESWQLWRATERRWYPLNSIIDILAAVAITVLVTGVWEYRRRRRGNFYQLRLFDLFFVTSVLGVTLSWLQIQSRAHASEQDIVEAIFEFDAVATERCCAPEWLQRLLGPGLLPNYFMRVIEVDLTSDDLKRIDDIAPLLADLGCLRRLSVISAPNDLSHAFARMVELKQLRTLDFYSIDAADLVFDENESANFAQLSQLTELCVDNKEKLDGTLRELIRSKLPNCRLTDLYEP